MAPPARTSMRVLAHRNFWPYLAGNLLSNCGTWFQTLAQSLLVFRLTGSTFLVGVVNFAQFAGAFLLAPWSGPAADRFDRRRLLIVTQAGAVAVSATLAILNASGHATTPVVILLALVLGTTTAFAVPALQALVPLLVDRQELGPAVALNSVTFNLARAIGPLLGAGVIALWGITIAFALNSVSYVALIVALLVVHPAPQAISGASRPRFRESIELLRIDHELLVLLGVIAAISLTTDPVNTLTPAFAHDVFGHTDAFAGVLIGAFGAGSVLAAFVIVPRHHDPEHRMIRYSAVLGLAMVAFALSPSLWFALVTFVVGGAGFLVTNTAATTVMQLEVDDALRGRVMALWTVAFLGVRPIGSLVDGVVAAVVGVRAAAVVMSLPALVAAVGLARRRKRRRPLRSPPMTTTRDLELTTPDGPMRAYEAVPDGEARAAVVVIQEAFGINDHIEDVTRRVAAAGYHAIAPALFHRAGGGTAPYTDFSKVLPLFEGLTDEGILDDVDAAIGHLHEAGFTDDRIGVVGFCFGGRVTFLVALRRQLGASVGYYGGGLVTARFPQFPALVGEAGDLKTPWLGLFGDLDEGIPVEDVEALRTALDDHATVDFEIVRYPDAGHGFHCDQRDSYHEESAAAGWQRTLTWFAERL